MPSLDQLYPTTITAATSFPSQQGFGTPLITAYHSIGTELVQKYTSVSDMITAGFPATHPAVLAATAIVSQNPHPPEFLIGREINTSGRVVKLIPNASRLFANYAYTVYVNGQAATYTSGGSAPTVAAITAGLKTAIDALSITGVTTTDNSTDLTVTAAVAANNYTIYAAKFNDIQIEDNTTDGGFVTDFTNMRAENDDFYFVIPTIKSHAVLTAAAAHIETLTKILFSGSSDYDIWGSGSSDVLSTLQAANYDRTVIMAHHKPDMHYPGAAWVGVGGPYDPGSITWAYKTLNGVETTGFNATQQGYIAGKSGNYYQSLSGLSITWEGKSVSGEYIDIIRTIDWTKARIQEGVFGRAHNSKKIPFTTAGLNMIESEIRAVFKAGENSGAFVSGEYNGTTYPYVIMPSLSDILPADKAGRHLKTVKFGAKLAGAIHKVTLEGELSL